MTETTTSRPRIGMDMVVLDTDDPPGLADFYTALLGWEVERADDDWITIHGGSDARIAFQLAPDHRPPTWPDNEVPQQYHLDFSVDDMESAVAYATSIGGRVVETAETHRGFTVLVDPSGHPFCLCTD